MVDKLAIGGALVSDLVFGTELAGTAMQYLGLGSAITYLGYNALTGDQQVVQQPQVTPQAQPILQTELAVQRLPPVQTQMGREVPAVAISQPAPTLEDMYGQFRQVLQQQVGRNPSNFLDHLDRVFQQYRQGDQEEEKISVERVRERESFAQLRFRIQSIINPYQLSSDRQNFDFTRLQTYPAHLGVLIYQLVDFIGLQLDDQELWDILASIISYNIGNDNNFLQLTRSEIIQRLGETITQIINGQLNIFPQQKVNQQRQILVNLLDSISDLRLIGVLDQRFIQQQNFSTARLIRSYTFQFMLQTAPILIIQNAQDMIAQIIQQRRENNMPTAFISPQQYGLLFQVLSIYWVARILIQQGQPITSERQVLQQFIDSIEDIIRQLQTIGSPQISDETIRNALELLNIDEEHMINPEEELKEEQNQEDESAFRQINLLQEDEQLIEMAQIITQQREAMRADIFRDYNIAMSEAFHDQLEEVQLDQSMNEEQKMQKSIALRQALRQEQIGVGRQEFGGDLSEEEKEEQIDLRMQQQMRQQLESRVRTKGVKDLNEIRKMQKQLDNYARKMQSDVHRQIIVVVAQAGKGKRRQQPQVQQDTVLQQQLQQAQTQQQQFENQFISGAQEMQNQLRNIPTMLRSFIPDNIRQWANLDLNQIIVQLRGGSNIIEEMVQQVPQEYRQFVPQELVAISNQIIQNQAVINNLSQQIAGEIPQGQPMIEAQEIQAPQAPQLNAQEQQNIESVLQRLLDRERGRFQPRFGLIGVGLLSIPLFSVNISIGGGKKEPPKTDKNPPSEPVEQPEQKDKKEEQKPKPEQKKGITVILKQVLPIRRRKINEQQKAEIVIPDQAQPQKRRKYTRRQKVMS